MVTANQEQPRELTPEEYRHCRRESFRILNTEEMLDLLTLDSFLQVATEDMFLVLVGKPLGDTLVRLLIMRGACTNEFVTKVAESDARLQAEEMRLRAELTQKEGG